MSNFLLKRNNQLQPPNSFAKIEKNEMEYIDGGYRATRVVYYPATYSKNGGYTPGRYVTEYNPYPMHSYLGSIW